MGNIKTNLSSISTILEMAEQQQTHSLNGLLKTFLFYAPENSLYSTSYLNTLWLIPICHEEPNPKSVPLTGRNEGGNLNRVFLITLSSSLGSSQPEQYHPSEEVLGNVCGPLLASSGRSQECYMSWGDRPTKLTTALPKKQLHPH